MNTLSGFTRGAALGAALLYFLPAISQADTLQASQVAPGYMAQSIELGVPFGGAIVQDPADENRLYVSAGNYAEHTILEVRLDTGTTRTVTPVVGNVGGIAVLLNGDLAITDNNNTTSDTILRAHDTNADGAWLDPGEITELIAPILVDGTFTGAQMAIAPTGNAAALPAGTLLVQTADGATSSELLAITDPDSVPAYRPDGDAWFSGFQYNGGIAFTSEGHVLCGISEFPAGRVTALVNANSDDRIDPGESHDILSDAALPNSIAGLGAMGDGRLIITENTGKVRMFDLPQDLLTGTASPAGVLAETNASYLSMQVDFPGRSFTAAAAGPHATVYIGGFVTFPAATNLLAIKPKNATAAQDWQLFK